jgi:hypothetical protein
MVPQIATSRRVFLRRTRQDTKVTAALYKIVRGQLLYQAA